MVQSYLKQHIGNELLEKYLALYDEYIAVHQISAQAGAEKGRKRTSLNAVKVLSICEQINAELKQNQKMMVLIQLLEYVKYIDKVTDRALDFVKTVADTFNISEKEYNDCRFFILHNILEIPIKDSILLIDNSWKPDQDNPKQLS